MRAATRRLVAEVQWGASPGAITWVGERPVHQYWPVMSPYFRDVLLPPQRRPDDKVVAWTWDEVAGESSLSTAELLGLRLRLRKDQELLADRLGANQGRAGEARGLLAQAVSDQLAVVTARMVEHLCAIPDGQLQSYVARTDHGLRLHSWGATTAAIPQGGESPKAETGSPAAGLAAPTPAPGETSTRRRRRVIGLFLAGLAVAGAGVAWYGFGRSATAGESRATTPATTAPRVVGAEAAEVRRRLVHAEDRPASTARGRSPAAVDAALTQSVATPAATEPFPSPSGPPQPVPAAVEADAASASQQVGAEEFSGREGAGPPRDAGQPTPSSGAPGRSGAPIGSTSPSPAGGGAAAAGATAGEGAGAAAVVQDTAAAAVPVPLRRPEAQTRKRTAPPPPPPAPTVTPPGGETIPPTGDPAASRVELRAPRPARRTAGQEPAEPADLGKNGVSEHSARADAGRFGEELAEPTGASPSELRARPPARAVRPGPANRRAATQEQPVAGPPSEPPATPPTGARPSQGGHAENWGAGPAGGREWRLAATWNGIVLLRDSIVPTEPAEDGAGDAVERLREELRRDLEARRPDLFRGATWSQAVVVEPGGGLSTRGWRWRESAGAGAVRCVVAAGRAELHWPSTTWSAGMIWELVAEEGTLLARVTGDAGGAVRIRVGESLRAWHRVAVVGSGEWGATITERPELVWQLRSGLPLPPTWREGRAEQVPAGWWIEVPLDAVTAAERGRLALIDRSTGWAAVIEQRVEPKELEVPSSRPATRP